MLDSRLAEFGYNSKIYKAYNSQRQTSKRRGVEFLLSFDEWVGWWESTGKMHLRGKRRGCYQMCRLGDVGPYSIDNIYCGSVSENSALPTKGKPRPKEFNKKTGDSLRGKQRSVEHRRNHAFSQLGKRYMTPCGIFYTAQECSEATGVKAPTVMWRCKNNFQNQWSYI